MRCLKIYIGIILFCFLGINLSSQNSKKQNVKSNNEKGSIKSIERDKVNLLKKNVKPKLGVDGKIKKEIDVFSPLENEGFAERSLEQRACDISLGGTLSFDPFTECAGDCEYDVFVTFVYNGENFDMNPPFDNVKVTILGDGINQVSLNIRGIQRERNQYKVYGCHSMINVEYGYSVTITNEDGEVCEYDFPGISGWEGCTDKDACNYSCLAVEDDGSCIKQGDPCEDGILDENCDCVPAIPTFLRITPPNLVVPFDGESIDYPLPFFQWEDSIGMENNNDLIYQFKLVEMHPKQSPAQALVNNYPWHEEELRKEEGELQSLVKELNYPINARLIETGKTYAWQVRVKNTVTLEEGISEAFTFTYESAILMEEDQQFENKESICNDALVEGTILKCIAPENNQRERDKNFKIRASISHQSTDEVEDLIPWNLSVKYEIRTAGGNFNYSEVGVFELGSSSSRKIDTYEIFDEEDYLSIQNAHVESEEVELEITDIKLSPNGIEMPYSICLELSIEEDEDDRFANIKDLLMAEQIIPNNDAFRLFYQLNPELGKEESDVLTNPKIPKMDDPEIGISEKDIKDAQAQYQKNNPILEEQYRELEQAVKSVNFKDIFPENAKIETKKQSLNNVLTFVGELKNGLRSISELSNNFIIAQTQSLTTLIKKGNLDDEEKELFDKLVKNLANMQDYNNYWHDERGIETGYLSFDEEEQYAMLGAYPMEFITKNETEVAEQDDIAEIYDIRVCVETLDGKSKEYDGWKPRFVPALYDPTNEISDLKKVGGSIFDNSSTSTCDFMPVADVKIWVVNNEGRESNVKRETIKYDGLFDMIKSATLGRIKSEWGTVKTINFNLFRIIEDEK